MLKHVAHRVPVTALAYLDDNVLLAGEGSYLVAYHIRSSKRLCRLRIFSRQSIHGVLVLDREHVLVWGGRRLASLRVHCSSASRFSRIETIATFNLQDWILDVAASPWIQTSGHEAGHCVLAAVTAHNALTLFSSDQAFQSSTPPIDVSSAVPGSNCILYSSHVTWLSPFQCLIASGTAFGDVIVWSCSVHETGGGEFSVQSQVHYNFSAHEGSVFGVNISLPLIEGVIAKCTRMLASCSDDRTICLWDITDLPHSSHATGRSTRDTGFGGHKDRTTDAPTLLAKAMGHVSRIWHARFCWTAPGVSDSTLPLRIRSFGEDASVITWGLIKSVTKGEDLLTIDMKQIEVETAHAGKHIWSVASDESRRFATGGADGAIAMRERLHREPSDGTESSLITVVSAPCRAYGFVTTNCVLSTLYSGRVFLLEFATEELVQTVANPSTELKGYSIMATVEGHAFIAGAEGDIYWFQNQRSVFGKIANTGSKVAGLFAAISTHGDAPMLSVLAYTLGSPNLLLYKIDHIGSDSTPDPPLPATLNAPLGLVPTTFATFTLGSINYAAVGTRKGSLIFYQTPAWVQSTEFDHHVSIEDLHPNEAVTSLMWTSSESCGHDAGYLHTTGRDGIHCLLSVTREGDELRTELVHRLALPFGPNIERCAIAPKSTNIWVWGFKSKDFIVFDISAQREIMRVECGGAHRNWAFQPSRYGGTFVWTQAGKVHRHTQTSLPFRLINTGGHGREIKSIAISNTEPKIIATGAEDTNIKLSITDEDGAIHCLQTLRRHNTGIQHMQWSQPLADGQSLLFSSGGFEEFFVWTIRASIPGIGVGVICESIHPNSNKSDLRITSFEVVSISDFPSPSQFQVTMTYSDSTLKKWVYTRPDTWTLLGQADYLTACLASTLSLSLPNPTALRTKLYRLTTSTDGHLTIWADTATPSLLYRHQTHQNAILACTSFPLSDGGTCIVTGGDDNALALTRVGSSSPPRPADANPAAAVGVEPSAIPRGSDGRVALPTLLLPRAHAAAVTGLVYLPDPSPHPHPAPSTGKDEHPGENNGWVISASLDQVLTAWRVEVDVTRPGVDGVAVRRAGRGITAVADVSGLEAVRRDGGRGARVVVVGVGVDLWDVVLS